MTSVWSVGRADSEPSSFGTSSLRTMRIPSTRPLPRISTGEARKRRTIRRRLPCGVRVEYSVAMSTLRRTRGSAPSCSSIAALCGSRAACSGSTTTSASTISPSSRSSGLVNAACAGPAPAEHHDLRDLRVGEHVDRMVRGVGLGQLLAGQAEHPGHVDGDVPVADHDRAGRRKVVLEVRRVRMAVVPGDELRRRMRPGQVLAGDPEPPVDGRPGGVDDRVMARHQVLVRYVPADFDVAVEAEALVGRGLLVDPRHRLDLRVVGRNAEAHEPERDGQALEHVDLDVLALGQQSRRGVEAGRAGADDRDLQRVVVGGAQRAP